MTSQAKKWSGHGRTSRTESGAYAQGNEDTMMVLKFFVFMSILVMLKQLFTGVGVN